ncbi:MAG: lipocalin family protein [Methylophilaceae bacterium]|nr:lipocalin family protein [Methylophilaceae bacterium]
MNSVNLRTVDQVDINEFMGSWYVIAHIPTFIEKEAYNAIESYELNNDGTIATTFTFNKGSLKGQEKTYNPKGFIVEGTNNAQWDMQFIWPFKSQYKITYLDNDYKTTVIARDALDYVWIMSRANEIDKPELDKIVAHINALGYNTDLLRMVPHQ